MIDLKQILKEHPNCLSSRATFKSILSDKYPDEKRMINLLTIVFECGIANRIKTKQSLSSTDVMNLVVQLENEYGIMPQYANESITVWANAFGVYVSKTVDVPKESVQAKTEVRIQVPAAEPVIVEGDISDYEIVRLGKYAIIKKFRGFDEDEIVIPNQIDGLPIKVIGANAFVNCTGIKKVTILEGIETIRNGAFYNCTALREVILPSSLKRLGTLEYDSLGGVFENCALEKVDLPEGITWLGDSAFKFCNKLKTINLPDSIAVIGERCFYGCKLLQKVDLPVQIKKIEKYAFCQSGLSEIEVPASVEVIANNAFESCKNLSKVILSAHTIGCSAFAFCEKLGEVVLSVHTIAENAFDCCGNLSKVILHDGVKAINSKAFNNCASLKEITIPRSVVSIGHDAFGIIGINKTESFVIACYAGSYGLEYARKHGFQIKNAAK